MEKTNKKIRAIIYLVMLLFLGWSTFSLMGDKNQIPIQMGFGLAYVTYALLAINKRLNILTTKKTPKIKLGKMKRDFNFFFGIFCVIFALFTTFLFVLADKNILNKWISSAWIVGVIFIFQGSSFLYVVNYLDKHKPQTISTIFNIIYVSLSIIFGWTSAQIAFSILELPAREDLFFATYGLLILPVIFIIYFDYVYDYKSKNSQIIEDIKSLKAKKADPYELKPTSPNEYNE